MDIKKLKGHFNYNYFEMTVDADAERHANSISMKDLKLAAENIVFHSELPSTSQDDKIRILGSTGKGNIEIIVSTKPISDTSTFIGLYNYFFNSLVFCHILISSWLSVPGGFRYYGPRRTHYIRILEIHKMVQP